MDLNPNSHGKSIFYRKAGSFDSCAGDVSRQYQGVTFARPVQFHPTSERQSLHER
jgi:hypothetical protein